MSSDDDRPFGWGVCDRCDGDCEEEDYNPMLRISLCRTCREKEKQRLDERVVAEEVFARR